MTTDLAVNLLDTFPGRMLIDWWGEWRALHPEFSSAQQYADSIDTEDYSGRVAMVLHMYLYGGDFKDVIDLDTSDPDIVEMSEAVAAALCSPSRETLLSPQSHHGNLTEFRALSVANRHRPSALPDGAFWTATKFACGNDAWLLHGEHDAERSPLRYDVHFDPANARIARVDSAPAWEALLKAHPREHDGTVFPDWPSIAQEWDAVHVSLSGLLCAEPLISQVPCTGGDPSGYTHCQSGPYVGVAEWAVPSTAWLRPSAHMWSFPDVPVARCAETGSSEKPATPHCRQPRTAGSNDPPPPLTSHRVRNPGMPRWSKQPVAGGRPRESESNASWLDSTSTAAQ